MGNSNRQRKNKPTHNISRNGSVQGRHHAKKKRSQIFKIIKSNFQWRKKNFIKNYVAPNISVFKKKNQIALLKTHVKIHTQVTHYLQFPYRNERPATSRKTNIEMHSYLSFLLVYLFVARKPVVIMARGWQNLKNKPDMTEDLFQDQGLFFNIVPREGLMLFFKYILQICTKGQLHSVARESVLPTLDIFYCYLNIFFNLLPALVGVSIPFFQN